MSFVKNAANFFSSLPVKIFGSIYSCTNKLKTERQLAFVTTGLVSVKALSQSSQIVVLSEILDNALLYIFFPRHPLNRACVVVEIGLELYVLRLL